MKFLFLFFVLSFHSFASSSILNLDKFRAEAISEISKYYGENVLLDDGKFYYRDGVGSTNLPPLFDYSSVMFVASPSIPLELAGVKIAYRLQLIGLTDIILAEFHPEYSAIGVRFPGSIMVNFKARTSIKEQEKIIERLKVSIGGLEINHLREIGVVLVSGPPRSVVFASEKLKKEPNVKQVDVDGETYLRPFEFDASAVMNQQSGIINVDQLRTISAQYYEQGYEFAYWTNIPDRLK